MEKEWKATSGLYRKIVNPNITNHLEMLAHVEQGQS